MSKEKKQKQLGMNPGTASSRLKKIILFDLVQRLDLDWCFQCGEQINSIDELSIEHRDPWLDSKDPKRLFFDLDNIAFSHLKCNVGAARSVNKDKIIHPSSSAYKNGCRCDGCKEVEKLRRRRQRKKGIKT